MAAKVHSTMRLCRLGYYKTLMACYHLPEKVITNEHPSTTMAGGLNPRNIAIIGVVAAVIILCVIGYFIFYRGGGNDDENGGDNGNSNRPPVADAGYPVTVLSGEEVFLSGNRSYDPDGDELSYFWDMDAGIDSNSDGIKDNDRDIVGIDVVYTYPPPEDTLTYIVTLNVTDGPLNDPATRWDTSTVRVTILVNETQTAPQVSMECQYQDENPLLGPHFVLRVSEVTSREFVSNFTYSMENPDGEPILAGAVSDIILVPLNATIRFIDSPSMTLLDQQDTFSVREGLDIVEGCRFLLYYRNFREPVGEIELEK
ncbi:MAG: hypothetical protein JW939_06880 [Candidatus Thermoplasmatota archaeon]|nr:hypothetical protein [Candidatus Thermoplasmatota archaeon]